MLDFSLILQVKFSVVHRIQPQCSRIAMGVETKATGDSKLTDSPDLYMYIKLLITTITATIIKLIVHES